jgi:hypothetical protein
MADSPYKQSFLISKRFIILEIVPNWNRSENQNQKPEAK